uniref:proline-rich protein HaeIII subfamily 1-like n=1 Tax=Oncorhynchus gorbuscha TaxID=8017 RepID=UPI001EAF22CD|nr:proline-rich protein HaeIII subfamily 1-like [Oncorhynchus gorbuscha]
MPHWTEDHPETPTRPLHHQGAPGPFNAFNAPPDPAHPTGPITTSIGLARLDRAQPTIPHQTTTSTRPERKPHGPDLPPLHPQGPAYYPAQDHHIYQTREEAPRPRPAPPPSTGPSLHKTLPDHKSTTYTRPDQRKPHGPDLHKTPSSPQGPAYYPAQDHHIYQTREEAPRPRPAPPPSTGPSLLPCTRPPPLLDQRGSPTAQTCPPSIHRAQPTTLHKTTTSTRPERKPHGPDLAPIHSTGPNCRTSTATLWDKRTL